MSKLTLSVDSAVVAYAKAWARRNGTSISHLVEVYLSTVTRPQGDTEEDAPILESVRGLLKGADPEAWHRHVIGKYR